MAMTRANMVRITQEGQDQAQDGHDKTFWAGRMCPRSNSREAEVPRKGKEAEVPPEEPHQEYGRKDIETHMEEHTYIYMHIYICPSMNTEVPQDK